MFRLVSYAKAVLAAAPFDGPPDAFGGGSVGVNLHRTLTMMKAVYSFAVNGGATTSAILLSDDLGNPAILPPSAVVMHSFTNWTTAATSLGSATISLGFVTTTDMKNALAVASATGLVANIPQFPATSTLTLGTQATGYQLQMNVGVAALTAGVASIYVFYVM